MTTLNSASDEDTHRDRSVAPPHPGHGELHHVNRVHCAVSFTPNQSVDLGVHPEPVIPCSGNRLQFRRR